MWYKLTHLQLPLTPFDFLSFGIVHDALCWDYITGRMVRSMKLTLDEKQDAVPFVETINFESARVWRHTYHGFAAQLAGYWREAVSSFPQFGMSHT